VKVRMQVVAYIGLATSLVFMGCGTVASVKPMGAGNKALVFSAGGPVAPVYDIEMPLPYSVLRYCFGLNENTDVHVGIHPTMGFFGNLGVDVGLTRHFWRNRGLRPGISAGMSLYGFYDFAELDHARLYPELSLILTYDISKRVPVIYLGVENMFQFTRPYIVPVCLVGGEFSASSRLTLNLEARWYAPNESGDDRVVDYILTPFGQGALGFVLGVTYSFSGR
jgi:hypothetical protein